MDNFNTILTPGMRVRHPDQPDWGTGQVQSNIGGKNTANFPEVGKVQPKISIRLRMISKEKAEFIISDNGIGLPPDIYAKKTETLGLNLVAMLAEEQLQGKMEVKSGKGTQVIIHFNL